MVKHNSIHKILQELLEQIRNDIPELSDNVLDLMDRADDILRNSSKRVERNSIKREAFRRGVSVEQVSRERAEAAALGAARVTSPPGGVDSKPKGDTGE